MNECHKDNGIQCCNKDEGWPLGIGLQELVSNHRMLLCLRGRVVSDTVKGSARQNQVTLSETTVKEPLMKCRKPLNDVKTGSW